jgi:hypothetical protein
VAEDRRGRRWLGLTVALYGVLHHLGTGLGWLGGSGETRWADWVDLGTPYAIVLSAGASLRRHPAGNGVWVLFAVGAVTYVEGHGIHLAANSIGNAAPGAAAHLWDEVVGHYLWSAGWLLIVAALTATFARDRPPVGWLPYALAAAAGLTHATNALEGGTAVLGLASAGCLAATGWATRRRLGRLLLVAYLPALLLIAGYGVLHGGFPEPSQL